jgi:hypothetical protein
MFKQKFGESKGKIMGFKYTLVTTLRVTLKGYHKHLPKVKAPLSPIGVRKKFGKPKFYVATLRFFKRSFFFRVQLFVSNFLASYGQGFYKKINFKRFYIYFIKLT